MYYVFYRHKMPRDKVVQMYIVLYICTTLYYLADVQLCSRTHSACSVLQSVHIACSVLQSVYIIWPMYNCAREHTYIIWPMCNCAREHIVPVVCGRVF